MEDGDELLHVLESTEAAKALGRFVHRGADPTQDHRATAPGLHAAADAANVAVTHLKSINTFRNRISMSSIEGDLGRARQALLEWKSVARGEPDDYVHLEMTMKEIYLDFEEDRPSDAATAARDYLAVRPALSSASNADGAFMAEAFLFLAGGTTREEFNGARAAWLAAVDGRISDGARWLYAFGLPSNTREDALAAMAVAPPVMGESLFFRNSESEQMIGHALRLAGRTDDAGDHFTRAVRSCDVSNRIAQTWARLERSEILAAAGRLDEACEDALMVQRAWRASSTSYSARKARTLPEKLNCINRKKMEKLNEQ